MGDIVPLQALGNIKGALVQQETMSTGPGRGRKKELDQKPVGQGKKS